MRVVMNGISALKAKTGVGHTTHYLHRALVQSYRDDTFWLYPGEMLGGLIRRGFKKPNPPAPFPKREGGVKPLSVAGRGWGGVAVSLAKAAYRLHLRAATRWGHFDLYHEPNFVPVQTHVPTVVTVHDLSVVLHPEWHPDDRVRFHEKHFAQGIARAEHVIVVSESVRSEVIDVLGLKPDRVTAVHNGIGDTYRPQSNESVEAIRRKLHLPPRYLLAVGTIEPRKNLGTLMKAFCELPANVCESCPLVLAGGWGWKSEPERELFETEARHRGAIHLGYVDDADLPGLYSGATALLFPSFYEGFGLPPVEMLACGGGVIASTADAVREVVGRHAILLDPHDLEGWRDAMQRVILDPDSLTDSRRGGIAHARGFTWQRAAEQTFGVYQRVLGVEQPTEVKHLSAAA